MPLSSGSPPSHSTKVFCEWAARHATAKDERATKKGHRNKALTPDPQRVFVLTIPQVIAGKGLRSAKRVAWRHFGSGPTAKQNVSAEILIGGKRHRVARTYGSKATSMICKALRRLGKKHSRTKRYEGISLLKISPLVGLAVWVRGRNRKEDLIFPLESAVPDLRSGIAHNYLDALPLLQRSANALVSQSLALDAKLRKGRTD